MIHIGRLNQLKVVKFVDFGLYLDGQAHGEILLPKRYCPNNAQVGDKLEVFIYFDSEDELIATTERPQVMVGEFANLKVVGVNDAGAFLNWGLPKDLLLPFGEQRGRPTTGQSILVYVYTDKASGRIVATMKFNRFLDKTPAHYKAGEQVEVMIAERTDMGLKAIINGQHWGLLHKSEEFGKLFIGKTLKTYIKQVRPDGKIDLSLQAQGQKAVDDLGAKILKELKHRGGFIPLSDKSSPEAIFNIFRTSKGTFKRTIGGLYKSGDIVILPEGIRLNSEKDA
ncbi:Conserved virulence factor B [Vibrio stylophorae]|uniref:Conserved virulence factor B n=1 Tax=Vibrio stylophorae TaxID=659351 RepID=A0ABN8DU05_9VIBR|nr:S1-like domain-containing RNA-binding protein [Vibrio stylophorae]CAH0533456.1 Conserved virulence factor B [Vibrio stylophorae]